MLWIAAALACKTGTPDDDGKPDDTDSAGTTDTDTDTDADADTDTDLDTDTGPPPAPNLSAILGDCAGAMTDPGAYPNQLQPGDDLHRIFLTDPAAVCNDGTPAPIYVRAATDPAHANDWVVHLQGGSECITYEECAIRWCGSEYYDASKMSSSWTPESIRGFGIHNVDLGENVLDGWNHVFFYYCSSDVWQGRSLATLTSEDGLSTFTVHREGHTIVDAALTLVTPGATSDDGTQVLPPLANASTVLFTGSSVGSVGAQTHLDWVAARLAGARVLGVLDAALAPDPAVLRADIAALVEAEGEARARDREAAEPVAPFGDESCEAALPADRHWECRSSSELPYHWITTPFVARMDLQDPPTGDIYLGFGATPEEFAGWVAASLGEMADLTQADGDHPGVFGPACAEHLGLEIDAQFLDRPIATPAGPVTLQAAVLYSLSHTPVEVIDADGTQSSCGP
jgi:hypothetical protein